MPYSPHHFVANNCHFIENSSSNSSPGIDILLKASSPEAAYDSSARNYAQRCFPGTREQYIKDIINWTQSTFGSDPLSPLFWLKGPAGVGKSAVAQTCIEKIKDGRRPCAGFFFSVNGPNKLESLFPSIAYQLSTIFPTYHDLLDHKIHRDKTLVDKTMRSQFRALFAEPFQELEENGIGIGPKVPIFIDGLDECEDIDAQCEIVEIIATAARDNATPFCWAFFSRPEPHLESIFDRADIAVLCHTTILPVSREADGEIELYLKAGLENILRRRKISPELSWPSDKDMRSLVRATGGLFIYAATVLRVVSQPSSLGPEDLLAEVLIDIENSKFNPIYRTAPVSSLTDLDAFYTVIMKRISVDMLPSIRFLTATLCMYTAWNPNGYGLGVMVLSNMLRVSGSRFKSICSQLSAVLRLRDQNQPLLLNGIETTRSFDCKSPGVSWSLRGFLDLELGGTISFHHKSFPFHDFLADPARSGPFCATSPAMHSILFNHYLDLQLDYQKSYCIRDSELVLAPGVPDSAFSLSNPYINEFVNSFIKLDVYTWAGGASNVISDLPGLDPKFRKKLGHKDYLKDFALPARLFGDSLIPVQYQGCSALRKYIHTTTLLWICGDDFDNFNVTFFERAIKLRREAGILKPYFPDPASRFEYLFRSRSGSRIESGLYNEGHGSKSIFWYWEINHDLRCYRSFKTADLAEGEKIFQAIPWDGVSANNGRIDWEEVEGTVGLER